MHLKMKLIMNEQNRVHYMKVFKLHFSINSCQIKRMLAVMKLLLKFYSIKDLLELILEIMECFGI